MISTNDEIRLCTARDIAREFGITYAGARAWIDFHKIQPVEGGGRGRLAKYDWNRVLAIRKDQERKAKARADIHRWVR